MSKWRVSVAVSLDNSFRRFKNKISFKNKKVLFLVAHPVYTEENQNHIKWMDVQLINQNSVLRVDIKTLEHCFFL